MPRASLTNMFAKNVFDVPAVRPTPVSRRDRPAKPALSREAIVAAALSVIDDEGAERLTMRRLATAVDTGAASLYVYFQNMEELHAAILDALLSSVMLDARDGSWRDRLVAVLVSYTEVLYAHPVLARAALFTHPSGPNYLNLVEALLALLHEGNVPVREAAWGVNLLLQNATATAAEQSTRDDAAGSDQEDIELTEMVRDALPATHPHVAAAAGELFSGEPEDRLAWGFEVLINGFLATPQPHLPNLSADPEG